ncbi:beta-N-acetylhexosaminidase [Symbioplanes lichenis]|uniref:beta-N-acetylhexosaminidase n=1 Tax=Symbioplanes lichenis TaxID=1629072 RepID=UPI002739162A|nr:beta-N-acetylhexosaminidase [Actinoplanes lichenis]
MIPRPSGVFSPGGYVLDIASAGVTVSADSPAGVFYAQQTLRQLPDSFVGRIEDGPRFAWRGVMLDVARHFMPVPDVLRFLDLMAIHKLNVLHLHLTDDQGWRLEVPGWPRLTSVGAWRPRSMRGSRQHGLYDDTPHGGCYTAADLRRLVAYASSLFISIVPEVDMPGHMQAALAAYPALGSASASSSSAAASSSGGASPSFAGEVMTAWGVSPFALTLTSSTMDFVRAVLTQVCDIFPSPLIGIGGDEVSADISAVVAFAAEVLASHGRRVYAWDDILTAGAPADAVIAAWRGTLPAVAATRAGHQVVSCPDMSCYLDYRQSDDPAEPTPVGTRLTLDDLYAFDPVPPGADPALILGAQANIWTEHMENARRVDYMAFPRLCAFAEKVWSPPGGNSPDFHRRLADHLPRLDALGVNYRPLSGPRPSDARPDAPGNPRTHADREAELAEMTAPLRKRFPL